MFIFGFRVNLGALVAMGLPAYAFSGKDIQNDREHALCMSPAYFQESHWDNLGAQLFGLIVGLTAGPWLGAKNFSAEECLENALSGYYLLLMCLWRITNSEAEDVKKVSEVFMSMTTVRTLLWNSAHMVERVVCQNGPFCPEATVEQCCEQHFGRVKSGQGTLTLKSYLLACQRLRMRQARGPAKKKAPVRTWHGMSEAAAKQVGHRAFHAACVFVAVAICNQSPKQVGTAFVKWYQSIGYGLIMNKSGREPAPDEDLMEHECSDDDEGECMAGAGEAFALNDLEFQASIKADLDNMMDSAMSTASVAEDVLAQE